MQLYRHGTHTVHDLKVHLIWCTKYRRPVLIGRVGLRVRDLIREICTTYQVQILQGHVSRDHVHLFVTYPPQLSVSRFTQYCKGKTSRKLLQESPVLRKQYWGQHLWARGYFVVSSGTITDEAIMAYIASQDEDADKRGDGFTTLEV
jgi:putative transposase